MAKITMGMTTWTEHPVLIHNEQRPVTLNEYAQHFPTVEVDTFFYALPQMSTIQNWLAAVPEDFTFIIKAHQGMTLHRRHQDKGELATLFEQYRRTIAPLVAAGQLKTVLFQFPPYFDASVADIEYLKLVRTWMGQLPVAVELRNSSWYQPGVVDSLISYCRDLKFTLVAADEPHDTVTSVPFKLVTTNPDLVLLRLHGRNKEGWANQDKSWRKTRTLYRYSEKELAAFAQAIRALNPTPKEICVVFNNNSAKDAAPNALQLQKMMGIHFSGLAPRSPEQLDLF
ncbi:MULTISPECIES: DUF72 domain-containing protein [Limosilactobacillus]|uniref:DUF72 domain-containing protein n=1 Tax=Limosilactobacillus panis DSM 6035 TaxID=1423782 RepID=A0A0R1XFA9_9LACO|nr:DUF72 domain-containing protein [Limosilactobacillus panis]KRM26827.1 hypothetical protein FD32_GL000229 [Limosilactobacillus panis DSM 6035]